MSQEEEVIEWYRREKAKLGVKELREVFTSILIEIEEGERTGRPAKDSLVVIKTMAREAIRKS